MSHLMLCFLGALPHARMMVHMIHNMSMPGRIKAAFTPSGKCITVFPSEVMNNATRCHLAFMSHGGGPSTRPALQNSDPRVSAPVLCFVDCESHLQGAVKESQTSQQLLIHRR
uniref:Secreted protein n=1 Tax=Eutreptiella gymnastica TaxID=73025 RepID=A0A7S1J2C7_9EUGL|mmetsp:Transcript_61948/g.110384  ORF Transcript_61948/g.110384 Transcript_61948/m.110384 type:complete len:113 (+) Transcript_61948:54-392(+)